MMPLFVGQLIEFQVSMHRIQNFLLCDEIVPSLVQNESDQNEDMAIRIRNKGNFHWGYVSPEEIQKHLLMQRKKQKRKQKKLDESEISKIKSLEVEDVPSLLALKEMDFEIETGKFVCIIGDVGSGKSSILSALIGDMLYLSQQDTASADLNNVTELSQQDRAGNECPIML